MKDDAIIELYRARSEDAILESDNKYGRLLRGIAVNILNSYEDADECANDTYMRAWNSIPPSIPECLCAFLGKITRNVALDRLRCKKAQRRGDGVYEAALDELGDCICGGETPEQAFDAEYLGSLISRYLSLQKKEKRLVFVGRYWAFRTVEELSEELGISESKIKSILFRVREGLRKFLQEEGINI